MGTQTRYGTNYTIADNPLVGSFISSKKWGGAVQCRTDVVVGGTDTGAGSILYVGKLPAGCIPVGVSLASNTGNAVTGTIGWSGDADALGTFETLANTLTTGQVENTMPTVPNTALTADKDVYITTAGAALEENSVINVKMFYVVS